MPPNRCSMRRLLLRICAVSCLANVVFFALMLLVQPHPATILARTAFQPVAPWSCSRISLGMTASCCKCS
jgi:hypothetical protein